MDLKRGVDKAVAALVEELAKRSKKVTTQAETGPGWHHLRQRRGRDRPHDRGSHAESRQ